jgi:branched-chain amino acid transport system permease protein
MSDVINLIVQGILLGSLYAAIGTGLSLTFGVMRVVNLAHGDLIVLASYLALVATATLGISPLLSLVVIAPLMFGLGYALQHVLIRRTLGKGPLPPLLLTFGLSIVLQNVLQLVFSADSRGLDAGAIETTSLAIGGVNVGVMPLLNLLVALGLLIALQVFLSRTQLGRAFRATSDDPDTARLMGINSGRIYALALGISLMLIAVAGVLLGIRTNFSPTDGPARLIYAFEAVIIGGMGSLWGTFLGGLLLGLAQSIGAQISPTWFQLAGHLLALAVLIVKPSGLFAKTQEVEGV